LHLIAAAVRKAGQFPAIKCFKIKVFKDLGFQVHAASKSAKVGSLAKDKLGSKAGLMWDCGKRRLDISGKPCYKANIRTHISPPPRCPQRRGASFPGSAY
jgi:hypothetical protein